MGTFFFRFVTIHAFDRRADRQADTFLATRPPCIQCSAVMNGTSTVHFSCSSEDLDRRHRYTCDGELAPALAAAIILADAAVTPYRLRNDLKCVEWDVKPYTTNQPSLHVVSWLHTADRETWRVRPVGQSQLVRSVILPRHMAPT